MKKRVLIITICVLAFVWACDFPAGSGCNPPPPQITVTGPIGSDAGKGIAWGAALIDLSTRGYVEEEFFYEGEAARYDMEGEMTSDGMWAISEAQKKSFKSRLLVRRPADPSKFNGTVVVEWFNVSGGADGAPGWMFNQPMLIREGFAWVGVSAQKVGVDGGMAATSAAFGTSMAKYDPERYGSLSHPGDMYSYDMYTQAAKVIKGEGTMEILGGLKAEHLIAYGESQSAFTLITYTNAIQPVAKIFDGLFIHSRAALAFPLGLQSVGGCSSVAGALEVRVRTDLDVPVVQFETEGDISGFYTARQPDTDLIRTWEVAGTAHADFYLASYVNNAEVEENVPEAAEMFACDTGNKGPQYIVLRAALKGLDQWIKEGIALPNGQPLEMQGAQLIKDELGNAKGGIRMPHVEVPIAKLMPTGKFFNGNGGGEAGGCNMSSAACAIFGGTEPFSADVLLGLYPTHDDYVAKVEASVEKAVNDRFMLDEEAAAFLEKAKTSSIPAEYSDVW